jgi:predicted transcriptional regulator
MENKKFRLIKDAYIQLRLNSSIKEAIKDLVEENNSTLSAFVEKALIAELKREGKSVKVRIEKTIV